MVTKQKSSTKSQATKIPETKGGTRNSGGPRPGGGRKKGGKNRDTVKKLARVAAAAAEGKLPHEILLEVARGKPMTIKRLVITYHGKAAGPDLAGKEKSRQWVDEEYYPTFAEIIDAAKAAAPYFAPKLAAQLISANSPQALADAMKELADKLPS